MEIDLRNAHGDSPQLAESLRSRFCIIGGGIAGLMLANLLQHSGSVTLLEAGGRSPSTGGADDPFSSEQEGVPHAGTTVGRVRALGGSSWTWGGQLLPLPQDAVWPVSHSELEAANRIWHVPDQAGSFLEEQGASLPDILKFFPELSPRLSRFVSFGRRNLAKKPGRALLASKAVKVVLHAPVVELELDEAGDRIDRARVGLPGGGSLPVRADQFILAAGTVESCRLLLASRAVLPAGIGNAHGQVGRNFHDHLTLPAAVFTGRSRAKILSEMRPWIFARKRQPRSLYSLKLEASARLRARLGLPPAMAHLTITEPENSGVEALRKLLKARQQGAFLQALGAGITAAPQIAVHAARLAFEARSQHRRFVSPAATVQLQLNLAQEAPSASRIILSEQRDENGMPRAKVEWRVTDGELASLRVFAEHLREGLQHAGYDEGVQWEPALYSPALSGNDALRARIDDARHAMGGLCMGTDPRSSVVNQDLQVHGVLNLYVASPGVFPDGSPQLPTLTLSAFCLRLAARLQELSPA